MNKPMACCGYLPSEGHNGTCTFYGLSAWDVRETTNEGYSKYEEDAMSQAASGFERQPNEKYYTPAWVVDALLSREMFPGAVWEPAAGDGAMVAALNSKGYDCYASDIEPAAANVWSMDFLAAMSNFGTYRTIITNPPYGKGGRLAVKFIERALEITRPTKGKVAMLLRVDFDSANGRRPIFGGHDAFKAKYVLTKRIRWPNLPQSAAGPTENHAWFVWDWARTCADPIIGYLP